MKGTRNSYLIAVVLLVFLPACSWRHSSDPVIAVVNGEEITAGDLVKNFSLNWGETLKGELRKSVLSGDPKLEVTLKLQVLTQLIDEIIMTQEAKRRGIKVTPEEVKKELTEMFSSYPGGFTMFSAVHPGVLMSDIERSVERNLYVKKLIDEVTSKVKVTDEEIKEYYDKHREDFFQPEMVRARQIVVKDLDLAKEILKKLQRPGGSKKFEELARKYSISPEAKNGGDLGYFSEDEMPAEFSVCFSLKKGQISKIVKSPYGYHIFKLEDKKPAKQKSLQEVKAEIEEKLLEQKRREMLRKFISSLRAKSNIVIYEDKLAEVSLL